MQITNLNGKWQFRECGTDTMYPVTIPGSVLSGLLDNKVIEDPYYRENEYPTRELLRKNFEFVRTFNMDDVSGTLELVCEGLDTVATVYINQKGILSADNMHRTYKVKVNDYLKPGENEIKIIFISPIIYMESHEPAPGKEIRVCTTGAMAGNQYIRKAHSMFGWDWGPQLPDIGIWRDIYIRRYEDAILERFYVEQKHELKKNRVKLKITPTIRLSDGTETGLKGTDYKVLVTVKDPEGNVIADSVDAAKGVKIDDPKLWWCNGLGEQPLYTVEAELVDSKRPEWKGNVISERIGLRTFTVSQKKDEWGKEFAFCLNGQKVFAMGADYIPEDCVYSRITRERMKYLIDSSKEVGFNSIRMWGGGYYPSKEFMDLCDEAGLLVWQDFMYACNIYELTDEFKESIIRETEDNVRRLRNHASLGIWCGNNEMESAWLNWGGWPEHSKELKKDYLQMFENIIPSIVAREDPNRFYWPSSPSTGGGFKDPDNDNAGDRHYWDVWHGEKPFTDYENYFFRFCSEFGFQSWPEPATVRTFAKEGDFNVFSKVMESHQKNPSANSKIVHYIAENFAYPNSFESALYVSQVLQGMAIKYGVEHWRRNRGRCMGAIYWQLNDNWPVASWSSIDYYGRWKALHYMARHFFKSVSGTVKRDGFKFTPYVQNETWEADDTVYTLFVKDMDNKVLFEYTGAIHTDSFGVGAGETQDVSEYVKGKECETYVEVRFTHKDRSVSTQVEPISLYKHMLIKKPELELTVTDKTASEITVTVKSDVFTPFVDLVSGDTIVIWEDNFFFLTDGETKTIKGRIVGDAPAFVDVRAISLADSYDC